MDLPLDQLRQFQEFEKGLIAALDSYDDREPIIASAMRGFTQMELLTIAIMSEDEFAAAHRCHEAMLKMFGSDELFGDGISIPTWVTANFPAWRDGPTLAEEMLRRGGLPDEVRLFVEEISRSRLGLYEVIKDEPTEYRLVEMFTGRKVKLEHSLGGAPTGSVSLCRVIRLGDASYLFGASADFPAERKNAIEDMVASKMGIYFPCNDDIQSYEEMMRLAGPYWLSIVAGDYDGDILNPDHYLTYYK